MFVQAAAKKWHVSEARCRAESGQVKGPDGKSFFYRDLTDMVARMDLPASPRLKKPAEFRYIGKSVENLDSDLLIRGKAVFGMDVRIPGMLYAALRRSPLPEQNLVRFDGAETKKIAGVRDVFSIEGLTQPVNSDPAVVVVAEDTWAAFSGAERLKVVWDSSYSYATDSSEKYFQRLGQALKDNKLRKLYRHDQGQPAPVKSEVELTFKTPFLVHAPMEPLVATARVTGKGCEIWAPTQDPQRLQAAAASYLGLKKSQVTVHVTFLGGGFGRKAQPDFAMEAVIASKKTGKPIKVVWTREDEVQHGFYHPAALQRIVVGLDKDNRPVNWMHHTASSTMVNVFSRGASEMADWEMGLGASSVPYAIPVIRVYGTHVENPLRRGWIRSVNSIYHAFSVNTMVDELSLRAGADPVDYSLSLLGRSSGTVQGQSIGRLKDVITQLRQFSDWDKRVKLGRKMGFAHHWSFGSYVAFVVEVEKSGTSWIPVQAHCVMDCGQFVNASAVINQIEGSVAFGMSVVNHGKVSYQNGQVSQSNFHDYPVTRMSEMPSVATQLVVNAHAPQGVGEPAVPPLIPALTNAISRAQGKRITELPLG